MIRISNIHLPLDYTSETVLNKAAKLINVDKKFFKSCTIFRRSIDARKKDNIFFLATVDAELFVNEEKICKKFKNAEIAEKYEYNVEKFSNPIFHCNIHFQVRRCKTIARTNKYVIYAIGIHPLSQGS